MKISILEGYSVNPDDLDFDCFRELGDLEIHDFTLPEQVVENVGDANAVIINKTVMSRNVLQKLKTVKYIGVLATGYNVVDIEAANELGITVTYVPAYSTNAVAQHTFALLLEMCNLVAHHSDAVHNGRWSDPRRFCFWDSPLVELNGKTFGVLGYGNIGRKSAEIARAFGMNVIFYNRSTVEKTPDKQVSLEQLFRESDVVTVHCPLTDKTKEIINKDTLALMKNTAFLINTSRGPVIDEQALADALNSGKIAGAGLDVLSSEPPKPDNPLLSVKNCVITPHTAWAARESRIRLIHAAAENLRAYINNQPINLAK